METVTWSREEQGYALPLLGLPLCSSASLHGLTCPSSPVHFPGLLWKASAFAESLIEPQAV